MLLTPAPLPACLPLCSLLYGKPGGGHWAQVSPPPPYPVFLSFLLGILFLAGKGQLRRSIISLLSPSFFARLPWHGVGDTEAEEGEKAWEGCRQKGGMPWPGQEAWQPLCS